MNGSVGAPLSVLHLGAGLYDPADRHHSTFAIWRALAGEFERYTVVGRNRGAGAAAFEEGNISVRLIRSFAAREAEFLLTQFRAVPIGHEVAADAVVAQCPMLGGLAGLALKRSRGAGLLVELHGLQYFTDARPGSADWLIQRVSRYVLPRADRIRVLSEGMRERVLARYGASLAPKLVSLPPRVDLSSFGRRRTDWRITGRPKIAMSGAVNDNKGQERLIRAVFSAGLDAEIWIFGDGPGMADCRALAAALGVADRVRFFGHLTHAELAELLPQADLLAVYSLREGTPRALMEAMAVGLPVVTVDVGFCADVVTDGVEGIVLGGDPDQALVQALRTLFADAAMRERMGRAGRLRVEREFDAALVYARYRALIRETVAP